MFRPITFLNQKENSIELFINAFADKEYSKYRTLFYYPKDKPEAIQSVAVSSQTVVIYNLKEGMHVFYLADNNGNNTGMQEVYISEKSDKAIVKQLIDYVADNSNQDYIEKNCFRKYSLLRKEGYSFIEILAKNYRETSELMDWEIEIYAKIMFATERLENMAIFNSNKFLCRDITMDNQEICHIKVPRLITYANVINRDTCVLNRIVFDSSNPDGAVPMAEDEIYDIELYADNELAAKLIHYQPDEKVSLCMRDAREKLETIDTTIIADINLNSLEIEMEDEEKNKIAEEKMINIRNWITYRPVLIHKANEVDMEIYVDNMELLKAFGKQFFIAARDEDIFMDNTINAKKPFYKNGENFNTYLENVSDNAAFWIQDNNGKIVSKYARTSNNYPDYEKRKEKLECYEYRKMALKSLSPIINKTEIKDLIDGELYNLANENGMNPQKMMRNMLLFVTSEEKFRQNRNLLCMKIIADWLSQFDVDECFFDTQTVAYYNSVSSIRFPVRDVNYVLVRAGWDQDSDEIHFDYKLSRTDRDTEFETDKYNFNIFYCISETDYRRSGFIYVSNVQGEKAMESNIFSIEEGLKDG